MAATQQVATQQAAATPGLSRAAVIEQALTLADAEGLDAVTIRRLAQHFGVTPMALYWHVQNKDELLAAMGDSFFTDLDLDATGTWDEQLHTITNRLVDQLRRHPAAVPLAFPRALSTEQGRDLAERVIGMLREVGFGPREATDIATHALRTAVMLVVGEPGASSGLSPDELDVQMEAKRAQLRMLDPERFPHLREVIEPLLDCEDEQAYYDFGVDLYVAGVRALRAQSAS